MRLTPEQAANLGLIKPADAAAIGATGKRGAPVLSKAVAALNAGKIVDVNLAAPADKKPAAKTRAGVATSTSAPVPGTADYNDAATNPQRIIYEALCAVLHGRVEWEVSGLIPGRQFRADIRIGWVVIEMDGFRFHKSKTAFQTDRDRQNLFVAHGFLMLRCYAAQAFKAELREQFVELVLQTVALADARG